MSARLSRRDFVRRIAGVSAVAVLSGCASSSAPTTQPTTQPTKVRRIGYLFGGPASTTGTSVPHFRERLRELGHVEGHDIAFELRTAENVNDRLPGLLSELIGLPVDVLVTQESPATLAAKRATTTIPIVFIRVANAVEQGIVASVAQPGGNVTGVTGAPLLGKNLEYLQALIPALRRVAVLANANNPSAVTQGRTLEATALTLGLDLRVFEVRTTDELDVALDAIAQWRPDAMVVSLGFTLARDLAQIPDFAAELRLPALYATDVQFVRAGGLMATGSNFPSQARMGAELVDQILRGARPAELPIALSTGSDFMLNLTAAQRIGLTIPESVLRQATEVLR